MKIIVDAFGGDHAPLEILKGAMQAVDAYDVDIILTGKEAEIRRLRSGEPLAAATHPHCGRSPGDHHGG